MRALFSTGLAMLAAMANSLQSYGLWDIFDIAALVLALASVACIVLPD